MVVSVHEVFLFFPVISYQSVLRNQTSGPRVDTFFWLWLHIAIVLQQEDRSLYNLYNDTSCEYSS